MVGGRLDTSDGSTLDPLTRRVTESAFPSGKFGFPHLIFHISYSGFIMLRSDSLCVRGERLRVHEERTAEDHNDRVTPYVFFHDDR